LVLDSGEILATDIGNIPFAWPRTLGNQDGTSPNDLAHAEDFIDPCTELKLLSVRYSPNYLHPRFGNLHDKVKRCLLDRSDMKECKFPKDLVQ
jgi:hypothetical protein